jgi:hypothetical protein
MLAVTYLHQPRSVDLSAMIINGQGDTQVGIHPNYIGPFVAKDIWGQVRIPPPRSIQPLDPQSESRTRALSFGEIFIPGDGIYGEKGVNSTVLENSVVALSGAAYWKSNATMTPMQVQNTTESGGQVLVMGSWGDVTVTFDGNGS